jgi:hypothetical protein
MANHVVNGATRGEMSQVQVHVQVIVGVPVDASRLQRWFASLLHTTLAIAFYKRDRFCLHTTLQKLRRTSSLSSIPSIRSCITSTYFQTRHIKSFFSACHMRSNGKSRSKFNSRSRSKSSRYANHPPSSRRIIPLFHHLNYPVQCHTSFIYSDLTTASQASILCLPPQREAMPR